MIRVESLLGQVCYDMYSYTRIFGIVKFGSGLIFFWIMRLFWAELLYQKLNEMGL